MDIRTMDIREAIKNRPMQWQQIVVIVICILLTMIDGYEIIVLPFVMPHLAKAWKLSPVEAGYLLSASVFGMALGAAIISPLADRIGRRAHILLCLVLVTVGMLLSARAENIQELLVVRAFAGLFIGGLIASINVLVSEYSSDKRRGVVMGLYGIGLPLGSALAGSVVEPLVARYGWCGPFAFGGLLTLAMTALVTLMLPESAEYLIERRPKRALEKYNKIAAWLGHPQSVVLPDASRKSDGPAFAVAAKSIFGGIMLLRTVCLWLGYAGLIAAFYFANTWTTKLIADATGSLGYGVHVGTLIMIGGVIGSLLFASLSLRIRPVMVTALILIGGAVVYTLYAVYFRNVALAIPLAMLVGVCASGGVCAFYAISPPIYPAIVRGTAVGLMIGFGRAVSVVVPIWTGYMLTLGWTPSMLYRVFGAVLGTAAVFVLLLDRANTAQTADSGMYGTADKRAG
ncbi:MFS transporter [Burkholderia sp. Bp8963]|uniref:MFS transporter n=1 Tax=Burkholderia sp. Bp8963 TaxID=2184547 RepID=UPI000F5B3942|nr:MFS transporter [Burkholderia sp. Bp8963]RQS66627.1 MFS transporter [Burkholderia sp. Bp8963]